MITTVALANISIMSLDYHFFFVVGTIKIQSLSSFEVDNPVSLSVITILYIRAPGLIYLLVAIICFKSDLLRYNLCNNHTIPYNKTHPLKLHG